MISVRSLTAPAGGVPVHWSPEARSEGRARSSMGSEAMDDDRTRIGRRLQEIRGSRDQRTFAEAVDSVQQTISKYERGEIPRSWLFLARLVEEEGVDLNRLLIGEPQSRREAETAGEENDAGHGNGYTRPHDRERRRDLTRV